MSSLMTTIEVDQNAAIILHSLKDKAEAQGVSLGELLQNLAGDKSIVAASFEQALRNEAMLEALRQTKELLKDIKQLGQEAFDFTILGWYKTRSGVRYAEMREQVRNDVLNDPNSYNSNVMNRFFKGNIE